MNNKKNIIILDINSHIHRAYHVAISRKDNEGEQAYFNNRPNYIIKRAIGIIESEIEKINVQPDYIACVLDADGKNFRHDLYPEYKINRPPSDKEFNFMRNCIYKILSLKGYYTIRKEGVEADDVIGSMALKAEKAGLNVYLGTDDKDFFQLVTDNIKVFRGKLNKLFGIQEVIEQQGVHPTKVLDYLAMDGDKADNVIGIPNCGAVTCVKILEKFTLDEILENPELISSIDKLRGSKKIVEYLSDKANNDFVKLMKVIVSLKDDLELGFSLKDLIKKDEDIDKLKNAYESIGLIY